MCTHGGNDTCIQNVGQKTSREERDHLGDLGIDCRIILKWILENQGVKELVYSSISMTIALMMEAVCTSETLVNFNVTTRCYIPEDSNYEAVLKTKHN
jgi:hypothetical protein